jgi:ribosome-associated protein
VSGCRRPHPTHRLADGCPGPEAGHALDSQDPATPLDVVIRGDMIRLGQLLKLADVVDSGGEAKALLAARAVSVNDEREQRRGRQLHDGDVVTVSGRRLRVVAGG